MVNGCNICLKGYLCKIVVEQLSVTLILSKYLSEVKWLQTPAVGYILLNLFSIVQPLLNTNKAVMAYFSFHQRLESHDMSQTILRLNSDFASLACKDLMCLGSKLISSALHIQPFAIHFIHLISEPYTKPAGLMEHQVKGWNSLAFRPSLSIICTI